MILTKLEPPNLDLQNGRYKFYKTTSKSEKSFLKQNRTLTATRTRCCTQIQNKKLGAPGAVHPDLLAQSTLTRGTQRSTGPTRQRDRAGARR